MGEATRKAVDVADRDAFSGGDGENQHVKPTDGNQNDFEFTPNLNAEANSLSRFLQSNNESNFGRRSGPIDRGPVPLIPPLPEPIPVEPPPQPEPNPIILEENARALFPLLSLAVTSKLGSSLIKTNGGLYTVTDYGSTFNDRIRLEVLDDLSL